MARIVIDGRSRGSTGRYANKLLENLQKLDHENEYLVLVKSQQEWQPAAKNFQPIIADVEDYTFAEQLSLWRIIRRLKPDLVHFTMPQQPLLPIGAKRVTTIHDLTMLRFHNINGSKIVYYFKLIVFRCLLFYVAHISKAIITPTAWVKADVTKTLRADPMKIKVTNESADPIKSRAEPVGKLVNLEFILFNGNIFPHKNIRRLIEAHQKLLLKHPKLKLAIAGKLNDQGQALKKEVQASNLKNIFWLGYVTDEQLKWLRQEARVYVYPSLSEGFGLPPLEAMLEDLPVAVSNATCLPEVCGDAAMYFDPLSTEDMARAIDSLLTDKKLRAELIGRGKVLVKKYSWRKMAEQTLDVFGKLI